MAISLQFLQHELTLLLKEILLPLLCMWIQQDSVITVSERQKDFSQVQWTNNSGHDTMVLLHGHHTHQVSTTLICHWGRIKEYGECHWNEYCRGFVAEYKTLVKRSGARLVFTNMTVNHWYYKQLHVHNVLKISSNIFCNAHNLIK
jgi:hypothetical protein